MSSDRPYLPCFSMVATGTCCHGFRCKFIHDPRILMRPVKLRKQIEAFMIKRVAYYNENIRNKVNKMDNSNAKDIFFWPAMGNEKEPGNPQDSYNPQWSSNTRFYEPGNDLKESEYGAGSNGGVAPAVPKIVINESRLPVFSQLTGSSNPVELLNKLTPISSSSNSSTSSSPLNVQ